MDRDSDISAALDTIADFCTQSEEQNDEPFEIHYNETPTEAEVRIIKEALSKWVKLNKFRSDLWTMFRNTIKAGDQFFLRDPETFRWVWVDHFTVEGVKVDETKGKEPDGFLIRALSYNDKEKYATTVADPSQFRSPFGNANVIGARASASSMPGGIQTSGPFTLAGAGRDPRQQKMMAAMNNEVHVVDAGHVVHLSLSNTMNPNWPFGTSVLEAVYKTYKQKEMLEDAIIIYRVQRAPERRIFYIDVGAMPPARAKAHIESIKNEIHQRRIPNKTGGGSSILDAAYNPLCLALDTKIPLLDGRTLTIAELGEEYRAGKENWVYSCHPVTGEVMPGNITWAGVTRKDAKVIRLHLDNGETLTVTPDHKIPVLGRGFVEAKDLTPEDSLIAFNTRQKNIDRKKKNVRTYTQVYDHAQKEWVYAHRMVGEFFRTRQKHQEFTFLPEHAGSVKQTIHHKDFNRYNNDPRNLVYMNKEDHIAYHVFEKKSYWENMPASESARIREKISTGLKSYYDRLSPEDRQKLSEVATHRNTAWIAQKRVNDPEGWAEWRSAVGRGCSEFYKKNPDAGRARTLKRVANGSDVYRNQSLTVTQPMIRMIVDLVKDKKPSRVEAASLLSANETFMATLREANAPLPGHANKIDYDKVSPVKLDLMVEKAGYKGWKDLTRKVAQYNHRIVRIEEVVEPMDVGTITVDGRERWHPHHTFAVASGIFVKNSVMEDYFFAQSAEGRGSKVETLPGGDQTGEITDLSFFSKKLMRGLRIPPSYMPFGDEQGASYTDGKLGSALIQEFRFNKYCMRIQNQLAPTFDYEFKYFLQESGIEVSVDHTMFEIRFNPPQNFGKYRQIEVDVAQVGVYQQVADNPRLSERFKMKRFLGLTDDEIIENETMWKEENPDRLKRRTGSTTAEVEPSGDLSSVGFRPPPSEDFSLPDLGDEPPVPDEGGDLGAAPVPAGGPTGGPTAGGGGAAAPVPPGGPV
jgi:hypothetical protein